jgi:glycosyltransferase involved in cell wall biosynthesis
MEQHVLDLVSGMTSKEHKVFVWCAKGPMVETYEKAGAQVTTEVINFDIDPIYIYRLFRFLKENKIDVLHSHELKAVSNGLIAGFLAKTAVRISHTHTPISEWQISPFKKKLNVLFYSFVVNILSNKEIALTESRKEVKVLEGVKSAKLTIIPNALDLDDFTFSPEQKQRFRDEITDRHSIPSGSYIFGNISRVSREKGHDLLVNAYADFRQILKNRGMEDDSFLFIGGGGPLEDELRALVKEKGLDGHVVITGRFASEDHKKFYSTFDSFIFPSLAEGFGIVLIEAMAFSLPVLCSDLEVLQEVGGSTVRYFDKGSQEDLSLKMFDLYQRQDQYYEFGEKARGRVEELYSMDSFVSKYEDLYKELLT